MVNNSKVITNLLLSLLLFICSLPVAADGVQSIFVQGSPVGIVGNTVQIDIGYNTSNQEVTTGLGLRVHYDSGYLNVKDVINFVNEDIIVHPIGPFQDIEDYDNDHRTDKYYTVGWASLFGNWPSSDLPATLLSLQVEVSPSIDLDNNSSTPINFSTTAVAAGYVFSPQNYDLGLANFSWDFDGNCDADALTDGLLFLRYAFGLRGDMLVNGVTDPQNSLSAAEITDIFEKSFSFLDIDSDGEIGALTDGLLLLRHLFDISGPNLINNVISTTATRTSAGQITEYLGAYMPNCIDDINIIDETPPVITSDLDVSLFDSSSNVIYQVTASDIDSPDETIAYSFSPQSVYQDPALPAGAFEQVYTANQDGSYTLELFLDDSVIADYSAGLPFYDYRVNYNPLEVSDVELSLPAALINLVNDSTPGQISVATVHFPDNFDIQSGPIAEINFNLQPGVYSAEFEITNILLPNNATPENTIDTVAGNDSTARYLGNNGLSFNEAKGEVSLPNAPDALAQPVYSFTVTATDAAGNSTSELVTVLIDGAPVITSTNQPDGIDENSGSDQVVYTAISNKPAVTTFALSEDSDAGLSIDASTGEVTLADNPDYETQEEYSFTVIATDDEDRSSFKVETVAVNNLDEVAASFNEPTVSEAIDENIGEGQVVFTAVADDSADVSNGITYSLSDTRLDGVPTNDLSIDSVTGEVTLASNPDHESGEQYTFIVGAFDGINAPVALQTVTLDVNDLDDDSPPNQYSNYYLGPLDMTAAYGNGAVSGDNGEFFKNDSVLGFDFSGFALNYVEGVNPYIEDPFTFGAGGTITFTASVPAGQTADTVGIQFEFQEQSAESGLPCDIGYVWRSATQTVTSTSATYTIDVPSQGGNTFSSFIMELMTDDVNVEISNILVTSSAKTTDQPTLRDECDGRLDMTGAYGDGAVSGDNGELFKNDTSLGYGYSGFANTTLTDLDGNDLYPFEFGSGGTLEFTASVPEGQAETAVDITFQFQKQPSSSGKFCDIAPIFEATRTVSGPVDETFTVAIPSQGGDTFRNLIMELSKDDVNVKVTRVLVTPSDKTNEDPTVPPQCVAAPFPSVYPEAGINTAAAFAGTFGDEEGGDATIQSNDSYEFPSTSASYGGWANTNNTLYPIDLINVPGGFFAKKEIYFCASTTEAATVFFRLENLPYPENSLNYDTPEVALIADGQMHAYKTDAKVSNFESNSFLFYIKERDVEITMGKVKGTWVGGVSAQNITTDSDGDGVVDYCEDFPNDTPDWQDTDGDGASDDVDSMPNDSAEWQAS